MSVVEELERDELAAATVEGDLNATRIQVPAEFLTHALTDVAEGFLGGQWLDLSGKWCRIQSIKC